MKTTISYSQMLEKLQKIILETPQCENIHIDSFKVLPTEQDGANWRIDWIRCSGDQNDITECSRFIQDRISELRNNFNVIAE